MSTPAGLAGHSARAQGYPFCHVTVMAPTARMDVALPVDLTVAELVAMLTDLAEEVGGQPGARSGGPPGSWCLAAVAGAELPPDATLASLGVLDGDLLRLRRRSENPPPPVFDDPVDAVAQTIRPAAGDPGFGDPGSGDPGFWGDPGRGFTAEPLVVRPWDDRGRRTAGLIGCGAAGPLAAVLIAGVRGLGPAASPAASVLAAIAAAAALTGAARTVRTDSAAAAVLAMGAVPLAACAGFAALPDPPGAGHLLVGVALAAASAAGGLALLGTAAPGLVAVALAGGITAFAGLLALFVELLTPAGAGAVVATIAVGLLPALPRISTRLAGLPAPVVPTTSAEMFLADQQWEAADPERIRERSRLAHTYLAGLVLGATAVAGVGAVVASSYGGRVGSAFAAIVVTVLMLRSRAYATAVASLVPFVTGLLAGAAVVVELATRLPSGSRIVGALVLLGAGAVGLWLVWSDRGREPSPVVRKVVDVVEAVLVIAVFPLALWVLDIYEFVRHLS
jgi:type VII secretion integral membrane protein EccD